MVAPLLVPGRRTRCSCPCNKHLWAGSYWETMVKEWWNIKTLNAKGLLINGRGLQNVVARGVRWRKRGTVRAASKDSQKPRRRLRALFASTQPAPTLQPCGCERPRHWLCRPTTWVAPGCTHHLQIDQVYIWGWLALLAVWINSEIPVWCIWGSYQT